MSIKVVVTDTQVMCRQGLCRLLQGEPFVQVVGQADNYHQTLELIQQEQPDVLVLDPGLCDPPIREFLLQAKAHQPSLKVVVMIAEADIHECRGLQQLGIQAVVFKTCEFDHLRQAIQCLQQDQTYLCPKLRDKVADSGHGNKPFVQQLSRREREVLDMVAQGYSTKEIAHQLQLSVKTVDTHRQHLMDKLKIRGIADLTRYAIRAGITPLQ